MDFISVPDKGEIIPMCETDGNCGTCINPGCNYCGPDSYCE